MKRKSYIRWWRDRSIFLKLSLIIIITAVLVNLAAGLFFKATIANSGKDLDNYYKANVNFMLNRIGYPPSLEAAEQMKEDFRVLIRYEGPDDAWSVAEDMPSLKDIRFRPIRTDFGYRKGSYRLKNYTITKRGEDYFISIPEFIHTSSPSEILILGLISLLSIIFIGAYLMIRRILYPIHSLKSGVQQIGEGNFDYQLPVDKNDEMGQLSQAFNTMAQRVKDILLGKEQFLLNVSHELRSPLTRMKIAIEFLSDSAVKNNINEDIRIMELMIAELLESARLNSGHREILLEKTDLSAMARYICKRFEKSPPGIKYTLPTTPLTAYVDPKLFTVVFNNLMENALKYSADADQPVRFVMENHSKRARIRIQDFGEGIPTEDLPFLFEPFYRVDKSRSKKTGGYGLGLGLCKKIVEAHGGTIKIKSQPNRGTEVKIELPLSKRKANPSA
ncbi:MAG: HAMP domain-containing histidine kinase [Proteobacteria bacterium]|nr:HAMP domain-containing histidine kinase [Pseudomonadota bacterium]